MPSDEMISSLQWKKERQRKDVQSNQCPSGVEWMVTEYMSHKKGKNKVWQYRASCDMCGKLA